MTPHLRLGALGQWEGFHYLVVNSTTLDTPSLLSYLSKLLWISPWLHLDQEPHLLSLNIGSVPPFEQFSARCVVVFDKVFERLQSRSKPFKSQTHNSPRFVVCDRQCPSKIISLWSASLTRSRALRSLVQEGLNKKAHDCYEGAHAFIAIVET